MAIGLEDLPAELLDNVVILVRELSDLSAICLTSQTLRAVATPHLYHNFPVTRRILESLAEGGSSMLSRSNPGLKHVRSVKIQNIGPSGRKACTFLCRLLNLLQRDSLSTAALENVDVDEETFSSLFSQQQKLQDFELGAANLKRPYPSAYFGEAVWDRLRSLTVPRCVANAHDLGFYRHILSHAPLLQKLSLTTFEATSAALSDRLHDSSTQDGVLLPTLFPNIANGAAPKLLLKELVLQDQSLCRPGQVLTKSIEFSVIQHLSLVQCSDTENLLDWMTSEIENGMECNLRSFRLEQSKLDDENIFNFLASFDELEELYIVAYAEIDTFDVGCLDGHKATLRKFALALPQYCSCDLSNQCFINPILRFVKKCPVLEQVASTLPHVEMADDLDSPATDKYGKALIDLLCLPNIKSLRIYNWPELPPDVLVDSADDEQTDVELNEQNIRTGFEQLATFLHDLLDLYRLQLRHRDIPLIGFGSMAGSSICDGHLHEKLPSIHYRVRQDENVFGEMLFVHETLYMHDAPDDGIWKVRP